MLDEADRRGDLGSDAFVPQRIQDYLDKAKVKTCFSIMQCFIDQALIFKSFLLHSTIQVDLRPYEEPLKVADLKFSPWKIKLWSKKNAIWSKFN